jgi:hypothetical protein
MGRVGDVLDHDRPLAAAADVGAVLGEGEAGVQAAGAEVVVADLLERRRLGGGRRRRRLEQREQRGDDQRRGSRQARG